MRHLLVGPFLIGSLLGSSAAGQSRGSVAGRVVHMTTRAPMTGVVIKLGSGRTLKSDSLGQFAFKDLSGGPYVLQAVLGGYKAVSFGFILAAAESIELDVELVAEAQTQLPDLVVEEKAATALDRKLSGFYSRMKQAQGTFISPRQLAQHRPSQLTAILRWVPGLQVSCRAIASNACEVTFERSSPESKRFGCPVVLFVDGVRSSTIRDDLDALISANQVAAVEAYRGIGELPREYSGAGAECGVVAVWLKPLPDKT